MCRAAGAAAFTSSSSSTWLKSNATISCSRLVLPLTTVARSASSFMADSHKGLPACRASTSACRRARITLLLSERGISHKPVRQSRTSIFQKPG